MKKITSQKFSKRLAKYGALSIAIAGVADASGQIVYTDIADVGGNGLVYQLDINGDATIDYTILNYGGIIQLIANAESYIPYTTFSAPYGFQGINSNEILGTVHNHNSYKYPFALNSGAYINSSAALWLNDANWQTMNWNSCNYASSQWCGVTDKFLGLRFDISGITHYGWARLDVPLNTSGWVIKDYAYNATQTVPGFGDPITAGQITLGLDDNELSKIKIVALNKSIALFNLPQQTNYRLFSLTGQSVLDGKITNNTHVIEANTLATGVYIIELVDKETSAVIRKKIVL